MGKNILIAILAIFDFLLAWTALHKHLEANKLKNANESLTKEVRKEKGANLGLLQEKTLLEREKDSLKQISLPGRQDQIEILLERIELLKRRGGSEMDLVHHFRVPMGNHNISWVDLGTTAEEVSTMIETNRSG